MLSLAQSPPEFSAAAQGSYDSSPRRVSAIEEYVARLGEVKIGLCALWASMARDNLSLEEFYFNDALATYMVVQGACARDVYRIRREDACPEHVETHIQAVQFLLRGWEHPTSLGDVDRVLARTLRQLKEFKCLSMKPLSEL